MLVKGSRICSLLQSMGRQETILHVLIGQYYMRCEAHQIIDATVYSTIKKTPELRINSLRDGNPRMTISQKGQHHYLMTSHEHPNIPNIVVYPDIYDTHMYSS